MTPEPYVQPLSYRRRQSLFQALFVVFIIVLPLFIFYAAGYRFNFGSEDGNIVGTGGMYVDSPVDDVEMFLNDEPIRNMRVFRNAAYIQNLAEGKHRIHVQKDGLQTWVKELPVFPHIVTEAESFHMPLVPQVRMITKWLTPGQLGVVTLSTTTEEILPFASTTNPLYATTSNATTSYTLNPEYTYVTTLFASSTTKRSSFIGRVVEEVNTFTFNSSRPTTTLATTSATTTVVSQNVKLYEYEGEVYAKWLGTLSSIPYYYCVDYSVASSTAFKYGKHVQEAIKRSLATASGIDSLQQNGRTRVCRHEIRIDRKEQEVLSFDFFPNSTDLVLMHLTDGVYVVEIDDRAWQNTQLLYPGEEVMMLVDGGQIYVQDGEYYLEVETEIEE